MALGEEDPQRHVVVFDVNICLDAAHAIGPPFTWANFDSVVAKEAKAPVPHPTDKALDSLRSLAVCRSGRFAGPETLEVWTNAHIDSTVRAKAMQSQVPDSQSGYRGLGWDEEHAQSLVDVLIGGLTSESAGGTLGDTIPDGNPPLDHEDGMVYGACRWLAGDDPLCNVYCVTRDRGFLQAHTNGELRNHTRLLTPSAFVALVRLARASYSAKRIHGALSRSADA